MDDFTEQYYSKLLRITKENYHFYGSDIYSKKKSVIWRHDVDYSPYRAMRLAKIEYKSSVKCIYHILLTSRYYNFLEPEVQKIFYSISELGHEIGLHYDFEKNSRIKDHIKEIKFEKQIIERVIGKKIKSISFHNYTLNSKHIITSTKILNLVNLASDFVKEKFQYISDSNGIWKEESLERFIKKNYDFIQVLTHPIWWTNKKEKPFKKFLGLIEDTMKNNKLFYLKIMKKDGRLNKIKNKIGLTKEQIEKYFIDE